MTSTMGLRHATPEFWDACGPRPDVRSRPSVVGKVVDYAWLKDRSAAWDRLFASATYQTVALSRKSVAAHIANGLATDLRFIVVETEGELLALMPFGSARLGVWHRANRVWTSSFTINATPLIDRDRSLEAIEALLDLLGGAVRSGDGLWCLPLLALDQPVVDALRACARRRGWSTEAVACFDRPIFRRRAHEIYVEQHLGRSERKNLRRRRKALSKLGRLEFGSACDGDELAAAVEQFLTLEASGWKGRRRTALASRPHTAAFARQLFGAPSDLVRPRADWLALDGRPLAISLGLRCGETLSLVKTAYDERYRAYAPGVLLEHEIVRACCQEMDFAEVLDSNSLPGGLLDRLYPERERIGELWIHTDPMVFAGDLLRKAVRRELLWRKTLEAAKRVYWRLIDASSPLKRVHRASSWEWRADAGVGWLRH